MDPATNRYFEAKPPFYTNYTNKRENKTSQNTSRKNLNRATGPRLMARTFTPIADQLPIPDPSKDPAILILSQIRSWKTYEPLPLDLYSEITPLYFSSNEEKLIVRESQGCTSPLAPEAPPSIYNRVHSTASESKSPPPQLLKKKIDPNPTIFPSEVIKSLKEKLTTIIDHAKTRWIENEPETAKQLLADLRREIVDKTSHWNPYDLLKMHALFYELEGGLEEGLQLFEENLNLYIRTKSVTEKIVQYINHLHIRFQLYSTDPSKYRELNIFNDFPFNPDMDHFFEQSSVNKFFGFAIDRIKLIINLAKFAHFSSQLEKKSQYLNLLKYYIQAESVGISLIQELEEFSIEIGDISVLINFDQLLKERGKIMMRLSPIRKTSKSKLSQDFISLLYQETAGHTCFEDLKTTYHSRLSENPGEENVVKYLQYLHFLIRGGEIDEARAKVQQLVDSGNFTNEKDHRDLMLIFIQILVNCGCEVEAMAKLEEFTTAESKLSLFLIEKALLHLNPLSQFFDIEEAQRIYAHLQTPQIASQYPQLHLLGYRIAAYNRMDTNRPERVLQLMSKELFGSIKILMCGYPAQLPVHEKNQRLLDAIRTIHGGALLQICDARRTGSVDHAYTLAEELYKETDRLSLYRQFICPTGICLGNLHEKIKTFTPSQRICTLFET